MKLKDLFKRSNKNAKSYPKLIPDSRTIFDSVAKNDSSSFVCIDKIANSVASLSFGIYDKQTHTKVEHDLYEVLLEPNQDETHSLFFNQIVKDYFAQGNIYLYKYTDENGNVTNLFRLNPSRVVVNRDEYNRKTYTFNGQTYYGDKILHIPSRFGYDGKIGHSIFDECAKAFETAYSLENYTDTAFTNNLGKRLVIDLSEAMPNADFDQQMQFRDKFVGAYTGVENASKPIVKTNQVQFSSIDTGIADNRATQLSESKDFQQKLISQVFGIPYGLLTGSDGDLETITTLYLTQAIQPIIQVLEESFQKLFNRIDREKYYIEFNLNSVLKTSLASKISSYQTGLNNGIYSINDIRKMENLSELPETKAGSIHWVPANLIPATDDNVEAVLAKSKLALQEMKTDTEKAEQVGTMPGIGSDKN